MEMNIEMLSNSDAPINWQNIGNRLIGNNFNTSVIGIYKINIRT